MLEPGRRRLFLDTLRPPEGYVLDRAVGTTFTLDLMTLLAVPLAFTFSDVQDRDGQIPTEPLSLLESARRYADRIVVFCQGGQTGVPRARQPALAFIEQSVIAGFPPRRGQFRGVFHPKVWVLRYAARDDTADEPIRYRLICQSRNLTFDASWDASLVLDGELNQERAREYPLNGPIAEFMRALPTLAVDPISNSQEASIEILSDELLNVRFDPPEGLELSRFLPFGTSRRNVAYPDLKHRPLLVVSPFLDGRFLQSVVRRRPRSVLISRREELLTAPAAGVIAQAIDHLRENGVPHIDVIYICSNQAIARQNVDRIRHHLPIDTKPLAERITLLPYRLNTLDQQVNLIALTPGTSFNSASAEGIVEERIILYRMLTEVWSDLGHNARLVFLGGLSSVARFMEYESWYPDREIDTSIVEQFRSAVKGPGAELHSEFIRVRDLLAGGLDNEAWRQRQRFVGKLRRLLAHACLDALEPDLVILDEFQRFRDLLNPKTTSGELAHRLFEYEDSHTKVRTLLLSATPYKMYTLSHESDDDHYRDFLQTVRFLEGRDGSVEPLEESLREFRSQLPLVASGGEIGSDATARLSDHRTRIQAELRRVMSRTERRGRAGGGDPMLHASEMTADLEVNDVEAYLGARDIATTLDAPGVTEYWKSAPYLLSFMDRYRLSDRVRSAVEKEPNGEIAKLIRDNPRLQLRRNRVEQRRSVPGGNGRMRALLRDLANSRLHRLLWLPPSLPSHALGRDFERARTATKRLVFSSWAMVPRAVAVMASYDAERRYVRDRARAGRYTARLLPVRRDAYSLFALMAPSRTEAGDPLRYAKTNARGLLRAIEEELRPKIAELTRNAPTEGTPQEIWYAAAPLLLDRESRVSTAEWLRGPSSVVQTSGGGEYRVWEDLATHVTDGLIDPAALGRPPGNLSEVMAALAAGSPANATLRALSRTTSTFSADGELKAQAMTASWSFRHLFRVPTSEGLLKYLYKPGIPGVRAYWRRVLAYALEGGLSAVLEEYFHVIREDRGGKTDATALVQTLCQALQLAAGTLDVTQWERERNGVRRETFAMRQHFARRYANDGVSGSDQQASQHLDAVRAAFNSPFWPFVLGTTSIGQEGLDFHWYCHAVVHWNLPPNPVDLEQREGRVHRYHGHAIRKNIAQKVGARVLDEARAALARAEHITPWDLAYRLADDEFADEGGLVPHWVFTEGDARIQRRSPVLPLSRDVDREVALRRSLAVYRMVFGQPRQDDLLEFILCEVPDDRRDDLAAALTIDLSPPS